MWGHFCVSLCVLCIRKMTPSTEQSMAIVGWWSDENHVLSSVRSTFDSIGSKHYQDSWKSCTFVPFLTIREQEHHVFDRVVNRLHETLKSFTFVIWWNWHSLPINHMRRLRESLSSQVWIMYNWDEPWCWRTFPFQAFTSLFNYCFVSSGARLSEYAAHGVRRAICLYPPYDEAFHRPDCGTEEEQVKYACDVSFMCTNLYTDSIFDDVFVSRKALLDAFARHPEINFHLYGTPQVGRLYPQMYKGEMPYHENRKVFSNSKISLSIHVLQHAPEYLNERCITTLASGGLLLVDPVEGIERVLANGVNCVVMCSNQPEDIVLQVKHILANYDQYRDVRQNGLTFAKQAFHVSSFCQTIWDAIHNA